MSSHALRPLVVLSCLVVVACAGAEGSLPVGSLMEGSGDTRGVRGLERLGGSGTYVAGQTEKFQVHVDPAIVQRVEFSASSGALSASGLTAEWTLPASSLAELTARVVRRDGSDGQVTWQFAIQSPVTGRTQSAQAALLAMPMPVLDGGTLEVSGGACDVRYEGTSNNVAIAFTTATHPALMYGRWNGATWALEVVDAMGFNTGGVVDQHVQLQVEANGTPNLVYVRDSQVFYATKVGSTWLRERVDSPTEPLATSGSANHSRPSLTLGLSGAPSIVYGIRTGCGSFTCDRVVLALRSSPGAWTRSVLALPAPISASNNHSLSGDVTFDGARLFFPVIAFDASVFRPFLIGWTPTGVSAFGFNSGDPVPLDGVIVSPTRALYRTSAGLHDVALNSTLANSTRTFSSVEQNVSSTTGDIVWAQSRPVLLHLHGSSLELVSTNAAGFWTYTQLGTGSSASASLTVHPSTGDVSLCYQANNRIMFQ